MKTKTSLNALYSFPSFRARSKLKGILGDSHARIITLVRRQKKRCAAHAAKPLGASTTGGLTASAIWTRAARESTWNSSIAGSIAAGAVA